MSSHQDPANVQLVCTLEHVVSSGIIQVAGEIVFRQTVPSDWSLSATVGSQAGDRITSFGEHRTISDTTAVFLVRVDVRAVPREEVVCVIGVHVGSVVCFERRMGIDLGGILQSNPAFVSHLAIDERSLGSTVTLWLAGSVRNLGGRAWHVAAGCPDQIALGTRILTADDPIRLIDERRQTLGGSIIASGGQIDFTSSYDTSSLWPGWYAAYLDLVLEGQFWFARNHSALPHIYFSVPSEKSLISRLAVIIVAGNGIDDTSTFGRSILEWCESWRKVDREVFIITEDQKPSRSSQRLLHYLTDLGIRTGPIEFFDLAPTSQEFRQLWIILPSDRASDLLGAIGPRCPQTDLSGVTVSALGPGVAPQIFRSLDPRAMAWCLELEEGP